MFPNASFASLTVRPSRVRKNYLADLSSNSTREHQSATQMRLDALYALYHEMKQIPHTEKQLSADKSSEWPLLCQSVTPKTHTDLVRYLIDMLFSHRVL